MQQYVLIKYSDNETQNVRIEDLNNDFKLSYCLTIHKSQGSQYDNVILFLGKSSMWYRKETNSKKLLYTAISRTINKCFIIGQQHALINSQKFVNFIPSKFLENE